MAMTRDRDEGRLEGGKKFNYKHGRAGETRSTVFRERTRTRTRTRTMTRRREDDYDVAGQMVTA